MDDGGGVPTLDCYRFVCSFRLIRAARSFSFCALLALLPAAATPDAVASDWTYQAYVDAGYAGSNRNPPDNKWRSKSTTAVLNQPELFLAMANVRKTPTRESRWGMELGLQTGEDTKDLVPAPPPPSKAPISNADEWRYLYRASLSWLFGDDEDVRLTGGLINSYIGYESYLAIDNPNYTRGYILDHVPYFLRGIELTWDAHEELDLSLYLVTGFEYLADPNNAASLGFQLKWQPGPRATFTQNLYYGPDQEDTDRQYWRFLSDSIIEWKSGSFLVAAALDLGSEKQAYLPGQPRHEWASGALWLQWRPSDRLSLALRPEFFRDDDGVITGAKQRLEAYTATLKYRLRAGQQRLVGALELRHDRSSGEQGGFFDEPGNRLVPDQNLVLVSVLWSLDI